MYKKSFTKNIANSNKIPFYVMLYYTRLIDFYFFLDFLISLEFDIL